MGEVYYVPDASHGEYAARIHTAGVVQCWQAHAILPSICIALRAFKIWLKLKVELVLISTY
ncbi:hypothetical protein D0A34_26210 [Microcoleus vaginatus PCC 9802]|uniref:hypothetical protein n=1 Tax=Microcoleus vaginatus TaxID=119532 RepID=UPI00020D29FA|nr:hypothetical protein MicvaDRAFT_0868 [Microcoleus vaginatus FGP-2]UNU21871.1 hypothetical protein D0A34_26210 [Microcoleus vaginatus PCC 9802]